MPRSIEEKRAYDRTRLAAMPPDQTAILRQRSKEWNRLPSSVAKKREYYLKHREELLAKKKWLNPERIAKERARRAANPMWSKTPGRRLSHYKHDASVRGLVFSISKDQFVSFWQKPCHYCGDAIETIGLDRVDNLVGYIMENIVPCCGPCNRSKMDASYEDFVSRAHRISQRHKLNTPS